MAGAEPGRPGAFVVSLDFELAWGVRHRPTAAEYMPNLGGARIAIPRILQQFEAGGIAATWATVGFLFACSRAERERFSPPARLQPAYRDAALNPYAETVGENEDDDPLHYAPTILAQIRNTPRQEIATHTLSHYFCFAAGQNEETFRADLAAARAIAAEAGDDIVSIVFPRNQHLPAYDGILLEQGIRAYRGTPRAWMWGLSTTRPVRRAVGLLNRFVSLRGPVTVPWSEILQPNGLSNVRASDFLYPAAPHDSRLTAIRLKRILESMRRAARRGEIYHLWWHPHNFGRHIEENLAMLAAILEAFSRLRDEWGMVSFSMRDVDEFVRGGSR
jgi:hypothetical protein